MSVIVIILSRRVERAQSYPFICESFLREPHHHSIRIAGADSIELWHRFGMEQQVRPHSSLDDHVPSSDEGGEDFLGLHVEAEAVQLRNEVFLGVLRGVGAEPGGTVDGAQCMENLTDRRSIGHTVATMDDSVLRDDPMSYLTGSPASRRRRRAAMHPGIS